MSRIAINTPLEIDFVYAGRLCVDDHWHLSSHTHTFDEFIILYQGAERVALAEEEWRAQAGDVLYYPKGCPHEEWAETNPMESFYIGIEWTPPSGELPALQRDDQGRMRQIGNWLWADHESYYEHAPQYRQALVEAFLMEYLRLAQHQEHQMVEQVRGYVRAHIVDPLTLEDLARLCGLSKYYFSRHYSALTGLTPMEDVRRIRLETARHLLITTRLPLKAIAPKVGFANEYHLSRLLKQHLGAGARELRKTAPPPV